MSDSRTHRPAGLQSKGRRDRLLLLIAGLAALALLGYLAARGLLREAPGSTSYGALADAFLHGRLWVERCPEIDCAVYHGHTYIIFPPLPAVLAMPFVALFGFAAFKGFTLLSLALSALCLVVWHRVFAALSVATADSIWLLLALGFASPLYQVTLRGDGVWFLAQTVGFLMMTLSIWSVVCRRSLALAGVFVGLAFLCRQMAIFYPPVLLALALTPGRQLVEEARRLWRPVLLAAIPVVAAVAAILAYDWARFGAPFETGYGYIHNPGPETFIAHRIAEIGLFSREYLTYNALSLFIQGAHFDFQQPLLTRIVGFDKTGVALLVASPWVLLAVYARADRVLVAGAAVIVVIAGLTLFYHSNGAEQINTQRYTLDWLAILVVLMVRSPRPEAFAALPLLVAWGVVSNAVVIALASRIAG